MIMSFPLSFNGVFVQSTLNEKEFTELCAETSEHKEE